MLMSSRRDFLRQLAAGSAGLLCAPALGAPTRPEAKKPDPFLNGAAQKAIASGLKYLKEKQHKDGSFGTRRFAGSVGITSLCGLALLSGRHKPGAGDVGPALDRALDFVLGHEHPKKAGYLGSPMTSPHGPMYSHGFAVSFLAAAHGKIADKERGKKVRDLLGRAAALTLASQNAEKGWRYLPDSRDSDLTMTACQVCALVAAQKAGVEVPKAALAGAAGYIKKCQHPNGGYRYLAANFGMPGWARTAAALLALYSAGVTRGAEVERGLAYLLKNRPDPKAARPDPHYFYGHAYAALATWSAGADARKKWYPAARDELVAHQAAGGNWKDRICDHYATAMALIALQAPNGLLSPKP
jgi:hypothetical protein